MIVTIFALPSYLKCLGGRLSFYLAVKRASSWDAIAIMTGNNRTRADSFDIGAGGAQKKQAGGLLSRFSGLHMNELP
jgi:hypothetical protein